MSSTTATGICSTRCTGGNPRPLVNRRAGAGGDVELEEPEVALDDRDRHVVDRHLADRPLECARVRMPVQDEVRLVLGDRSGETVGAQECPDTRRLAADG